MDPMANVALKYPNVKFLNNTGYKTSPNMGNYMGRGYETSYLAGIAAAKMTKNNHIGYVAPFPIPEIMYTLNAFALGAQSVNPDINVSIVWSSAWDDPTRERQAAISLLDQNVDVLGAYQNTPAALMATAERGKFGLGAHANMDHFAPEAYITNPIWNWGPYYVNTVKQIMDGTWKPESYFGSMKDGVVDMAPFGKNVPKDVIDLVNKKKAEILSGDFQVFKGPLYDQSGKERLAKDAIMTDEQILSMDWFVKGIKGSIPKS
jgi:basic membrane protein A